MAGSDAGTERLMKTSYRPFPASRKRPGRDSSLTPSVRHAGGGNESCLMRTVHAGRGWLKFEISLLPS